MYLIRPPKNVIIGRSRRSRSEKAKKYTQNVQKCDVPASKMFPSPSLS